jgi:hypothetical protein
VVETTCDVVAVVAAVSLMDLVLVNNKYPPAPATIAIASAPTIRGVYVLYDDFIIAYYAGLI